uniref:Uncharacterized protein n=1 Tax=Anguilla anguilla TaxID=7936 RepID=A0A0E9SF00_ANGAN
MWHIGPIYMIFPGTVTYMITFMTLLDADFQYSIIFKNYTATTALGKCFAENIYRE